jgi:RNA polymerase sigma-70 factor (ECF subfamily)
MGAVSERSADQHELFVQLLNQGHRQLLAYLISLLGNRHDAEDVFQRVSLILWRRFDTFEPGTNFMAWATMVAFYEVRNFQRVASRSRLWFDDELLEVLAAERVPDLEEEPTRREALNLCLEQLDDSGRHLVEEAYFEDGSIARLATQLGRAPQTLYNKLNAIRRMLAQCIERRLAGQDSV